MPIREAAQWTGVSRKTIRGWIKKGLPQYRGRPRGKILLKPSDIDAFLTKETVCQVDLNRIVEDVMSGLRPQK